MNTGSPGSHLLLGLKRKVSLLSGFTWGLLAGCRYLEGGIGWSPEEAWRAGLLHLRGCCMPACLLKAGALAGAL